MARAAPLLSLGLQLPPKTSTTDMDEEETPSKGWYNYIPLFILIILILAPHPSLLIVLVKYHLGVLQSPLLFGVHLLVTYALTFCAFCSLIVCVSRDPGPITAVESRRDDDGDLDLSEALMAANQDDDLLAPGKFCRKCWLPKPERAHHCSTCGRCVLKMDHHCVWIASKCIGHRTYPAFVHFLACLTLLALYIAVIASKALWFAFNNPMSIDETTPIHELFLSFMGIVFTLVIGSFLAYHSYLVTTNQTTLENLSPFLLLRYLPPLQQSADGTLEPLDEDLMSHPQRRVIRDAHGQIRIYDIGWRRNWAQLFGWNRKWGWALRLLCGGGTMGDGRTFLRNSRSEEMLARLATELMRVDKQL